MERGYLGDPSEFRMIRVIARQPNSEVLLATDQSNRKVIIKTPHRTAQARAEMAIFDRLHNNAPEAEQPHLVRYLGHLERASDGKISLVMEYIEGFPGHAFDLTRSHSVGHRLRWMLQVAKGISHLHEANITHNDVKLENVVIDPTAHRAVLIDLGLSGAASAPSTRGTLLYMPPEKLSLMVSPRSFSESPCHSKAADVYAWAISTWEILAATEAYQSVENLEQLHELVSQGSRPPIDTPLWLDNLQPVADLLVRCWQYNPLLRPDMKSIISELETIILDDAL